VLQTHSEELVRVLTLDRPEALNAFNGTLFDALTEGLLAAADDASVRVAILTGTGRAFSAGLDLSEVGKETEPPVHGSAGLFEALIDFPKPLMLAINGLGVGFGATICGLADMAFMGESARLRCPFTSLGLTGEAGSTATFPSLLGHQAASWMLYSSAWLDAEACKSAGLVLDVFPDDRLAEEVMGRAQTIAAQPLSALLHSKALLMGPRRERIRAAIRAENAVYAELMGGPDNVEAINAFREKRQPNFA
jgi:enoyl-CoA hydratase/carnithine racemase